jgi:hypothetical protein
MIRRLLAALHAKLTEGRLEPGMPHAYAPEHPWRGCWCGSTDEASLVHGGRAGR